VTNSGEKTLVLGLGNVLMGDEGIGVHVVRALEQCALPDGVECLDGGTGGFILLEPLQSADRIVLIDAAADASAPGTITRTTPPLFARLPADTDGSRRGCQGSAGRVLYAGRKLRGHALRCYHRSPSAHLDKPLSEGRQSRRGDRPADPDGTGNCILADPTSSGRSCEFGRRGAGGPWASRPVANLRGTPLCSWPFRPRWFLLKEMSSPLNAPVCGARSEPS